MCFSSGTFVAHTRDGRLDMLQVSTGLDAGSLLYAKFGGLSKPGSALGVELGRVCLK
jgi:hypothetical protein